MTQENQAPLDGETGTDNKDPWIHRSQNMLCPSCMYYVSKANADGSPTRLGRCRRHAPTMSGFPVMFETDWCGDHKLNEMKI